MIELLIIVIIAIVVAYMLGVGVETIIFGVLCLLEFLTLLCLLFFIVSAVMYLMSKKVQATFDRIDGTGMGKHAIYIVDNEEVFTMYPVDDVTARIFYRTKEVTVRRSIFAKSMVFDKYSLTVMSIGLPVFLIFSIVFGAILI